MVIDATNINRLVRMAINNSGITELIRPWSVGRRSDVMRRRPDLGVRCYEETVRWNPRDHTLRYVSVGVCKISIMGFTWSPHLSFIFLRLALLLLA